MVQRAMYIIKKPAIYSAYQDFDYGELIIIFKFFLCD